MIRFQNAHIGYREVLLNIADLQLGRGQLYILAGRNGSGKSTLLKTIIGQQSLLTGELLINDLPVKTLNERQVAHELSFVRSTFPNVDFLKVEDYVALGRTPHTNALGRLHPNDYAQVDQAFAALEIEHLRNKFTTDLSDGERQLVAIARAVAQETGIILLDEPTAFLDYTNKSRVLELLKKICSEQNKCIVLSSHDIELSVESSSPFLVIDPNEKNLVLLPPPVRKEEVIARAFS